MPRKKDVPCAGLCGTLLRRDPGYLPPGQAMCRECRARHCGFELGSKAPAPCAGGCGKLVAGGHGILPGGQRTCRDCRSRARVAQYCSEPGCVRPRDARGLCKTHWAKAYGHRDIEKVRANWRAKNHRRRTLGRMGDVTAKDEQAMRLKAKRCPLCRVKLTDVPLLPNSKELDHIVPRAAGGTHTHGNVRIICRDCNVRRPSDGSDYFGPVTLWAQAG